MANKDSKSSAERRQVIEGQAKKFGLPIKDFAGILRNSYLDPKMNAEIEKIANENKSSSSSGRSGSRGSAGGGGMNPADIEKVPGKRQLKFKSGGSVSASKRADGCAVKGKTKGKMV
jgi:hypothetical protein